MLSLDYYWQKIQERIEKIPYPYNRFIQLSIIILFLLYAINEDYIKKYIGIYHDDLNFFMIISLFAVFAAVVYTLKKFYSTTSTTNKRLNYFMIIALFMIIFAAVLYTYDYFHLSKPPEDVLVVAISPFNLIDEYGKTFDDINTRDEFKEKLEEKKNLGIKIIILDSKILSDDDAKFYGEKVGAHLVLYGESKKLIGKREEIKYNIYALPSLKSTPSEIGTVEIGNERTGKASYSTVTDEPIVIIESIKENASSIVFLIGAFEKYKSSNFTSAINLFRYIKNYENSSSILFYIANCYYFNNNLNISSQYFDKAIGINPQYVVAWNNKGGLLYKLGRYEEALTVFDKAIGINPQYAAAWNNKGFTLDKLGRYEEALAASDKATEINPQDAEAWNNKGIILGNMGRYKEAVSAYDKAIEINPQYADAWYNKGGTLGNMGRYKEALAASDKAIEINPQDAEAWNNKGIILGNMGRYKEALAASDKAIEINPQYADAWHSKGVTLYKLGRYEEARIAFESAHKLNPKFEVPSLPTNLTNTS